MDALVPIPLERWDVYGQEEAPSPRELYGAFVPMQLMEGFDASFFGISAAEARAMDPQQRLLLQQTVEALRDAGMSVEGVEGVGVGVFLGLNSTDFMSIMSSNPSLNSSLYSVSGGTPSIAAGRVSFSLGLQGPCMTYDTACSSSLVALHGARPH